MQSLDHFIDSLAESTPTPGGGGAAGVAGALAASLNHMVAGLTANRRKYAQHQDELNSILERSKTLRADLIQAIEDDAHVYKRVVTVLSYRTDKNDQSVTQAIEDALIGAAQVPLGVIQLCNEIAEIGERLIKIGLEHAAADAAGAIFLAQAAAKISLLNIKANMREVTDNKLKTSWINKGTRLVNKINEVAEQAEAKLGESMSKPRSAGEGRRRRRRAK
ncbi:MAG: cyclodeaminase/cyclohydrolase family protein [Chloroflexota bacterium]